MKYIICSVRDIKAATYSQPFFSPTLNHGIRSFYDAVSHQDQNNMMLKHPDDFQLFLLGHFDDQLGTFDTGEPQLVATGTEAFPPAKQGLN